MNKVPAPRHLVATLVKALLLAVRAVFAAGIGALVLAGLPYGLVRYIGWPLPHHTPSIAQLKIDLTSPILDDQVYLNAIAVVLWFLWFLLLVSFLVELTALLRRVERPRLPVLNPFQALAFVLLTTIGLTALMARTATPARAAAFTVAAPTRESQNAALAPARPGPAAQTATTTETAGPSLTDPAETVHVVVPGDTLFRIAQEDYDNADNWPVLAELNEGILQPDGRRLTDPNLILPGWRLITTTQPTTAPPAATQPPAGNPSTKPADAGSNTPTPPSAPTPARTPAEPTPTTTQDQTAAPQHSAAPTTSPQHTQPASASTSADWVDLAAGGALATTVLSALGLALARARRHRRWYANCYWPRPDQTQGPATLTIPAPLRPAASHSPAEQTTDDELDEFGAPLTPSPSPAPSQSTDEPAAPPGAPPGATPGGDEPAASPTEASPADPSPRREDALRIPAAAAPDRILTLQELGPLLALTGPGALGAARAIAAAVLSCREHHPGGAQLLLARQDAALLFERPEPELLDSALGIPALELTPTPSEAIDVLEHYLAYRASLLREHDLDNVEELDERDLEYHPPLILLAVVRADHTDRLQATLKDAAPLRAHAVLLGAHPTAPTWHIDASQHINGPMAPPGSRAFHLSADALHATLTLLERATGHHEQPLDPIRPPDPDGELADPAWEPGPAATTPTTHQTDQNREHVDAQPDPDEQQSAHRQADPATTAGRRRTDNQDPKNTAHLAEQPTSRPIRSTPGPQPPLLAPDADAADTDEVARIIEDYMQCSVRVDVLGIRTITTPTGTVDTGLRQDAWRLITRLAVHHRASHSAEDLAVLWPDYDESALRKHLRNALYDLRTTLKQRCGDTGSNPARYIQQRNRRYSLNQQFVGIDLLAFTRLRSLAATVRDRTQRAAAARAALEFYRGELLAGQDEEWILAPRGAARRDALATATLLAQIADQNSDPETALTWWERALQIDDNEEVYRQIIQLQARMGRRADAIATRDLLIARLDADQLSPAPTTLAILADTLGRRPGLRPRRESAAQ